MVGSNAQRKNIYMYILIKKKHKNVSEVLFVNNTMMSVLSASFIKFIYQLMWLTKQDISFFTKKTRY